MDSVPTGKTDVVQVAVREAERVTAEHPEMAVPFDVKPTVPVGVGGPAGATVAVNVTDSPEVDGFALDVTVVVEVAWLTTCVSVPLLPALLLSPE
jgi:hypothetical protein